MLRCIKTIYGCLFEQIFIFDFTFQIKHNNLQVKLFE